MPMKIFVAKLVFLTGICAAVCTSEVHPLLAYFTSEIT